MNLDKRCLGQNGTFWACPLAQGIVEAFNMVGEAAVFAHSLVLSLRNNGLVSPPEVAIKDTLLVVSRDSVPELFACCLTPSTDHASYDLPRSLTEHQPDPALVLFMTHKRPQLVKFQDYRFGIIRFD